MDWIVDTLQLKIARLVLSRWRVNSFIVVCPPTRESALIDVPPEASQIVKNLEGTNPRYVLLTHGHIDHIAGLGGLKNQITAPLAIHEGDRERLSFTPDILLQEEALIRVGSINMKVIHTPGHTPGSVCFLIGEHLFSGDTLFPGGPGRTDSPSDFHKIIKSISEKLFMLPDDIQVYPGHGDFTTLKKAKAEFAIFNSKKHSPDLFGDISWTAS